MRKKIILILIASILSLSVLGNELPAKKISFDFENVPLSYALNVICRVNDINLMFNQENDKNITVKLDDIETNKAIEMLVKQTGLDYIYENNILIVDQPERINTVYNKEPITIPGTAGILIDTQNNTVAGLIIDREKPELPDPIYRDMEGISKGTLLPARLEVGLISSTVETPALVRITHDIKYKDKVVIPKGSLMIGRGLADFNARQILVVLDTLIIGDREIDINAHMVKNDGTPGFCTEYIDLQKTSFWQAFALGFVGMMGNALKDKLYIEDRQGNIMPIEADTLKNDLINSTQKGLNTLSNQILADARKHNAIIIVEAGVEGFVFIDEKIPLEVLK